MSDNIYAHDNGVAGVFSQPATATCSSEYCGYA